MNSRELRIGQLLLAVAFGGLGIWALVKGDHVPGAGYLAIGITWLWYAVKDRFVAARKRQRARSRS